MTEDQLMDLAIHEAEKCNPENPADVPKVGAVIAINGELIASSHRGDADHAEKLALDHARNHGGLGDATVYSTLEPCTREVRSEQHNSCSERLAAAGVKKVVIGILDPNQSVCGRGVLRLQQAGIEVALFPEEKAKAIRQMNQEFIRRQQSLGVKIETPKDKTVIRKRKGDAVRVELTGSLLNLPPQGGEVYAIVQRDRNWWPNAAILIDAETLRWRTTVGIGGTGEHVVHLFRVNSLGLGLISFYYKVGEQNKALKRDLDQFNPEIAKKVNVNLYPAIEFLSAPKGWDVEDRIQLTVLEE